MSTANKVKKILSVGDYVYSATGIKMKVISKSALGFETEEDFFAYDEHRKLYFLTEYGLKHAKRGGESGGNV